MIRHTILFKIKNNVSPQVALDAIQNICELKNKLPGIISIIGGECTFHTEISAAFFKDVISHSISIDFQDKAAYDAFINYPITHPAKNYLVSIVERGYEGIIGLDFIEE